MEQPPEEEKTAAALSSRFLQAARCKLSITFVRNRAVPTACRLGETYFRRLPAPSMGQLTEAVKTHPARTAGRSSALAWVLARSSLSLVLQGKSGKQAVFLDKASLGQQAFL